MLWPERSTPWTAWTTPRSTSGSPACWPPRPNSTTQRSASACGGEDAADFLGQCARAASSVIDLLNGPDRDRLALCEAPRCGQLFLQDRPNQQWCCSACGNRARAARHHAVKKDRS
ncbi:CGNR zinc finger domain-containing protein [Rhodococcus sp. 14-2483-1-2]|uniref:CGNR zinc finger domain-containing protein n=1 Tax=Rhodococcus sp. 14-2483-1-2 TaxID=2023147 RepID=UPI000B9B3134|nr:hypothetical protein CH295_06970 [Rhodococcus sp. 14-2483-1-2]